MTNERLNELKQLVLDELYVDETGEEEVFEHFHTISTTQQADLLALIDQAKQPQSDEVRRAIELLDWKPFGTHNLDCDCVYCNAMRLAITALRQMTAEPCEWCKEWECGDVNQVLVRVDVRHNVDPDDEFFGDANFCPNCGRRLGVDHE